MINEIFLGVGAWGLVKAMVLVGEGVFLVFSLVVVRQVQLMVGTIEGGLSWSVKLASWLLLAGAVALFVFSVVVL